MIVADRGELRAPLGRSGERRRREAEPVGGEIGVLRQAVARGVEQAEVVSCARVFVGRGPAVPDRRGGDVARHACAGVEHHGDVELGLGETGLGGFEVPAQRLGGVARQAESEVVQRAETE